MFIFDFTFLIFLSKIHNFSLNTWKYSLAVNLATESSLTKLMLQSYLSKFEKYPFLKTKMKISFSYFSPLRLYTFNLDDRKDNEESPTSPSLPDDQHLSLMTSSMAKVKLRAKENIHVPKLGPSLTATMIGNPISKSSLSILKQSLPA